MTEQVRQDAADGNLFADGYAQGLEVGREQGWLRGVRESLQAAKRAKRDRSPQVRLTYEGGVSRAAKMVRKMLDRGYPS